MGLGCHIGLTLGGIKYRGFLGIKEKENENCDLGFRIQGLGFGVKGSGGILGFTWLRALNKVP